MLRNAMDLSEKLGARVIWIKGDNVAEEIARYAQSHNVTKIVMGKPRRFGLFPSLARLGALAIERIGGKNDGNYPIIFDYQKKLLTGMRI